MFSGFFVNMVRSGETTGQLSKCSTISRTSKKDYDLSPRSRARSSISLHHRYHGGDGFRDDDVRRPSSSLCCKRQVSSCRGRRGP